MFIPFGFMSAPAAAPPSGFDPDAQAFFTAVTNGGDTLTTTEENAVNQLVLDLKANSQWTIAKFIYPLVGGTATSHKWNLKDPQDTDAAFRVTWGSNMAHNSSGIEGISNNVQSFGNTHYNPDAQGDVSAWISMYCNGNMGAGGANPANWYDMSAFDGLTENGFVVGYNNKTTGYMNLGPSFVSGPITYAKGLYTAANNGSTNIFYEGTSTVLTGAATYDPVNYELTIGASNRAGGAIQSSARGYGFVYYAENTAAISVSDLNTSVNTYVTSLGRS